MNLPPLGFPTATPIAAPAVPANYFSGANGLDASSKLPFLPPGFIGRVRVDTTKGIATRKGDRAFVAELTVLTSNIPDRVFVDGKYSWYQSLKEPGTAYPTCIAFLYAALGLDQQKHKEFITAKIKPAQDNYLNQAANANILAGAEMILQTANKKLKDGISDFTLHSFAPTPEGVAKADAAAKA
jgi:hypothetical protein